MAGRISFLVAIPALLAGNMVAALTQSYCSDQNTGGDMEPRYYTWQSNGECFDTCKEKYAFAVVQDVNCWCSNYVPAHQLDVSGCNKNCPGFPEEQCGNIDNGLYGYVPLQKQPLGTKTAAGSSPTQTSAASPITSISLLSSKADQTVTQTVKSSAAAVSSTKPPNPVNPVNPGGAQVSLRVVTVSGAAVTETVVSTGSPESMQSVKSASSGGVIAGAVVGSLAGLAAIVGVLMWFLVARRRREQEESDSDTEKSEGSPRRNVSTLSKTGLLRSTEKEYPTIAIPATTRSSTFGHDTDVNISPNHSERRNSKPLFYDQRLNPSALMDLDNGSRASINTMADDRDYTRTLNVRNPDPPERAH